MEHLDPGPGQPLARWINHSARALHKVGIKTMIHWDPGQSGINQIEEADRYANVAREGRSGGTVNQRMYTLAAIRTR